jgi:hypothetical protein
MAAYDDPYVQLPYALHDDAEIYDDDRMLALWVRLVFAADALWPAAPEIPARVSKKLLARLVERELIEVTGKRFRIPALDTRRQARFERGSKGARARWSQQRDHANAGANGHANAYATGHALNQSKQTNNHSLTHSGSTTGEFDDKVAALAAKKAMPE